MRILAIFIIPLILALMLTSFSLADQLVKKPRKDADGRFWVYREKEDQLPFIPHGWMPEECVQMIILDIWYPKDPHDGKNCIAVTFEWKKDPWWCGIAWMTWEKDKQGKPWWGQDDSGPVYDLTGTKRLVFFSRGKNGNERIQVKIGILCDKPFGDVIKKDGVKIEKPIESDWLTLTEEWREYTLDLEGFDLEKIANGFTLVSERRQQADEAAPVSFFIDDIYYSWEPPPVTSEGVTPKGNFVTTWGDLKQDY